jgi:nucleoid DNA-binding protein
MNLTELTKAVVKKTGVLGGGAEKTLKALIKIMKKDLEKGETVNLSGFGSFHVITHNVSTTPHPETEETVNIPAHSEVQFRMAKELKKALLPKGEHVPLQSDEIVKEHKNEAIDSIDLEKQDKQNQYDRSYSMLISIPKGAIVVLGLDADDHPFEASGIDISMHGISFLTPEKPVQCITNISYPHHKVVLNVKRAGIYSQNNIETVAVLSVFENDVDDWMHWIELMTRLNEKV